MENKLHELYNGVPDEWSQILIKDDTLMQIIDNIFNITKESDICPPIDKWFEFSRLTNLSDVKVVIIGMDPYPNLANAHGLAFSSLAKAIPGSLINIYKCLKCSDLISYDNIKQLNANLSNWAKQGVLLFNAALSTKVGKSGHHSDIWRPYTSKIIESISNYGKSRGISYCFLLWGAKAYELKQYIDPKHIVMKWRHPSPMSQNCDENLRFINCDHFKKVNDHLLKTAQTLINWDPRCDKFAIKPEPIKVEPIKFEPAKPESKLVGASLDKPEERINENPGAGDLTLMRIFTDGGCHPNNSTIESVGSYAAVFVTGEWSKKKIYGILKTDKYMATNQRAEGMAIYQTLKRINKGIANKEITWNGCEIFTDSEFWINMLLKWMPSWSKEKFAEKKNPDLTRSLYKLWVKLSKLGKPIKLTHVNSHNKSGWRDSPDPYKQFCYQNNDYVDKLVTWVREDSQTH